MRAFVVTQPDTASVMEVEEPVAGPGEAVIDVQRVGVCGTDVAFFTGEMPLLHDGNAWYPMRLGHEWMGTVTAVGEGVDAGLLGKRVAGDTMLGCQQCDRCAAGYQHVCEHRFEVGVRGGKAGALAERICVPAFSLHVLPDSVDDALGALVEPSCNALRAVQNSGVRAGERLLVAGPGTIGLIAGMFGEALGAEVHFLGRSQASRAFAHDLGFANVWTAETLPDLPFHGVINATNTADTPAHAVDLVEPGRTVVFLGLSGEPGLVDSRIMVFNDVTAIGQLSGSPAMGDTVAAFADGSVDPRPLIAATIGLDELADVLAGGRPANAGPGPKIHIDPRR